jgi:hypothetical protein
VHHWLHCEGFKYTEHKKALYYDGHDWSDVVYYCQKIFLPAMAKYCKHLVEYMIRDVEKEQIKLHKLGEQKLVLCAHDEMTSQANDGNQ